MSNLRCFSASAGWDQAEARGLTTEGLGVSSISRSKNPSIVWVDRSRRRRSGRWSGPTECSCLPASVRDSKPPCPFSVGFYFRGCGSIEDRS